MAVFSVAAFARVDAQSGASTMPCAAWLATLAAGARTVTERLVLYDIEQCKYPPAVVLAAREEGIRKFMAEGDAGNVRLYIAYTEGNNEGWIRDKLVATLLPGIVDKSRTPYFRGMLMLTLANELRSFSIGNKPVYATEPGQTPLPRGFCIQTGSVSENIPTRLLQPAIDQIRVQAQAMIDDPTEVPQLREAAHCLLYAANHPDRWP
jgi:hypothetical protein